MIGRLWQRLRRDDGGPSCREIMEVLQSYLDGEVGEETARRVAGHLGQCPACAVESDVYDRIKASLATRRRTIDPEIRAALEEFTRNLPMASD